MGGPIEEFAGAPKSPPWRGRNMTEEQKAERAKYAEEMTKFRSTASMDRFKLLKKKFKAEGVKIEVVKFNLTRMNDAEIAYCFKVAKTLGAKGITLERSDEAVKQLSPLCRQIQTPHWLSQPHQGQFQ